MLVLKTISAAKSHLQNEKNSGKKIAFVPTMGALHDGHLALVEEAKKHAEIVVVSIFVNKAQFNDLSDYEKYPRQLEDDLQKLQNLADYVFAPSSEEMFLQNFSLKIAPIQLANCLCGATRPGHFEGVAKVVTRLFEIIQPDVAVFGEKDFQQLVIIKNLGFAAKIIGAKTLREANGLAMSSRNQRLSEAAKIKASELFKILNEIASAVKKSPQNHQEILAEILQKKRQQILDAGFEKIDYLEIRDEKNLRLLAEFTPADIIKNSFRIFVAAHISGVRLIDNLFFDMTEALPKIAAKNPFPVVVEAGKKYFWCSCGASVNQPFCDGSHKQFKNADGTSIMKSVMFEAAENKTVYFCGCKRSKTFPLCDSTHKTLSQN